MSKHDDFMDFMIFNEVTGGNNASFGGGCGLCCMPIIIVIGIIGLIISL